MLMPETILPPDLIGAVGVAMLLLAFVGNLTAVLERDGALYLAGNAIGAGLACLSAALIGFIPFVVLEGVWCTVAIVGLIRLCWQHVVRPAQN